MIKKIGISLLLLALMACGAAGPQKGNTTEIQKAPEGVKGRIVTSPSEEVNSDGDENKDIGAFTNSERIGQIMNFLASDQLRGRDSGSPGIEKAAQYIEDIFSRNGVAQYFSSYRDTLTNFEAPAYNVVGVVEGNDENLKKEFIVIGAHYDHIGVIAGVNNDTIANGANDNASGTATVLELARYFGNARTNKRSLIFALFSAEEKGLLGSEHLAKRLKEQQLNLYTMLNFEMTGVPLQDKDYFVYVTGYEQSNLAEVCNRHAGEKLVGFLPTAKEFSLFQRSDNYPFHKAFGVPSQTYCTFDFTNFNHYHKVGDEVSEMDFGHMATLVNKMIPVVRGIANTATREVKYN